MYGAYDVLIVEDNPQDVELLVREMRSAGILKEVRVAADGPELRAVLQNFAPDVILCDFTFPNFDGPEALRVVREFRSAAPVIVVSGSISDKQAISLIRSGAVDYVPKSSLERLSSAVQRAVHEGAQARLLQEAVTAADERTRQHAARLESLLRIVNDSNGRHQDVWLAMLSDAAKEVLPGQEYNVVLGRVVGDNLVLEAILESSGDKVAEVQPAYEDNVLRIEGTLLATMREDGVRTRSWDDIHDGVRNAWGTASRGWRAGIVTTFSAGDANWNLSFLSREPATRPFSQDDRSYIELLGSFFASHVQQSWQFDHIRYQQSHDALTGLPNRAHFRAQARAAIADCPRFAILKIDVNAFGDINEAYGQTAGDSLLAQVGNALQSRLASGEIVGRVAGDVFGIFVPDPPSKGFVRERALDFAETFSSGLTYQDEIEPIALTANVGIAVAPDDGVGLDAIMSHASAAVSVSKQRNLRGALCFYEAGMEGEAQQQAALRNEIVEAVATNQFVLHFQPHVDTHTGRVCGAEALVRWNHPTRGLLSPFHFIPFAEKNGIITSIDAWVMKAAFASSAKFRELQPDFRLYFNLSGRMVSDMDLIRTFMDAARSGVDLTSIGVEITETDAMRDIAETRRVCKALRELGVEIAIDDFGTGYSSLSSLKQLTVDTVKIDRSFVSGLPDDAHDEVIAETIISISKRFGFQSQAEGVETEAQIAWLKKHACTYMQGYAICYPQPFEDIKKWMLVRMLKTSA